MEGGGRLPVQSLTRPDATEAKPWRGCARHCARDEFIAVAARELRNPMTPIGIRVHALLDAARKPGVNVPPRLIKGLEGLALVVDVFVFLRRAATLLRCRA